MTGNIVYDGVLAAFLGLAPLVFLFLTLVRAPYGRYSRPGWGPSLSDRVGWVVMEAPASLGMFALWLWGAHREAPMSWVFLGIWQVHYAFRAFVYPLRKAPGGRRMPVAIALSGAGFNVANAWLNGRWLFELGPARGWAWLADPRFLAGTGIFVIGLGVNRWADGVLAALRQPGETGYRVPMGGLYRRVSCPNYLGEIVQWGGWALLTWSPGGAAFAVWTAANLVPRARSHHRWYRDTFPDYPKERRALVPGLL